MKRIKIIILIVALLVGAIALFYSKPSSFNTPKEQTSVTVETVSVVIDTGESVATVSGIAATNAFDALKEASIQKNIPIKTKQYDFGVFVEQIGEVANTKDKSWIYFVNGVSGTVAADKQAVQTGDSVEWRYMTPLYEN